MTTTQSQDHPAIEYLTAPEAADYLRLPVRTFREKAGGLPRYQIGRRHLFRRSDLDTWMKQFRRGEASGQVGIRSESEI